jgi:hypothetical protein
LLLAFNLEATLAPLGAPARTALEFAELLPPDSVPWLWLKALVTGRHPELARFAPDEPDPWLAVRRRLEGLRLFSAGDHPELTRLHRLVAAHLPESGAVVPAANPSSISELQSHLAKRAGSIYHEQMLSELWELDVLLVVMPVAITKPDANRELVNAAVFMSAKVLAYRSLPEAAGLLQASHAYLLRTAAADPSNAVWQRDLSASGNNVGDVPRHNSHYNKGLSTGQNNPLTRFYPGASLEWKVAGQFEPSVKMHFGPLHIGSRSLGFVGAGEIQAAEQFNGRWQTRFTAFFANE